MDSKENLAYLAGIIDGEGYLSIACTITVEHKTYSIRPILEVGNTDRRIVEFCKSLLGSNIRVSTKNRQKPYYRLSLQGKQLEHLLQKLLPYLISKKEVAKLILQFIAIHHYPRTNGYSVQEIQLANQIRAMSHNNGHRARQIPLTSVIKSKEEVKLG